MIKTLQKKFVVTAMIAISILIVVLLGTINIINGMRIKTQNDNVLDMLVKNDGIPQMWDMEKPAPPENNQMPEGIPPEGGGKERFFFQEIFNPDMNADTAMAARYFLVRIDENNNIVYVDIDKISSVTEDEACTYVEEVLKNGETDGKMDGFKYRIADSFDGKGKIAVFLNVSHNNKSLLSVLITSIVIGILCWITMLLIVIYLSKKAIRPIAANMERQKQFVTDAGHELKTPLAIIMANTEALELHQGESKWSKNIKTQAGRLGGLMQNLLTLSKMDESEQEPIIKEFDISRMFAEQLDAFAESAKQRELSLKYDIQPNVKINANKDNILQVVTILLDNSIKYAKTGTAVEVYLTTSGKKTSIKIKNTCEKLPKVQPEKLFDRFYRDDEARTQKNGGYGIGLSVARAIVNAHKGNIYAEYNDENQITFNVIL